jgi:cell division protein FtsQ
VAKTSANSGRTALADPADAEYLTDAAAAGDAAEEFYRPQESPAAETRKARAPRRKADAEDGEPFLRARRRVPVRRGLLPAWTRTRWGRAVVAAGALAAVGAAVAAVIATENFLQHNERFRIESAQSITTVGNSELTRAQLLSVFGADIGRNLFHVPLAERRAELQKLPWVEQAAVMRVLPNELRVAVKERTPVAFAEVNGQIELVDAAGVLLTMSPQEMAARHYSFPVVTGINPGDPLSMRAARMVLYQQFLKALDAGGENLSAKLSQIDLSDPEDVKATVPANGKDLLLHFGQRDFLARWQNYAAHVAQWEAQYPRLVAVDLRYRDEVVLKMARDSADKAEAAKKPEKAAGHRARERGKKRAEPTRRRRG